MEVLLDAILVSPPYVCLALAYGLVFGMLGVMDLTVSARFTAGAYGGWMASTWLAWYPALDPLVLIVALLVSLALAFLSWLLLAPFVKAEPLAALVGSLGLAYAFQAGFELVLGPAPRGFASYPVESGLTLAGITGTPLQWIALVYAILATALVAVLLRSRLWGRGLRAVAADPDLAMAVFGLSRRRLSVHVTVVTALILAPIAVIHAAGHGVAPATGMDIGLLAFVATIVAGRSRPLGAAGVALGLVVLRAAAIRWTVWEFAGAATLGLAVLLLQRVRCANPTLRFATVLSAGLAGYITVSTLSSVVGWPRWIVPANFQDIVPYVCIVAALLVRPTGLFVRQTARVV